MARKAKCMYAIPRALTGFRTLCGMAKVYACNGYRKNCLSYKPHTKESLAVLNEIIEEMKSKERNAKDADK